MALLARPAAAGLVPALLGVVDPATAADPPARACSDARTFHRVGFRAAVRDAAPYFDL